MIIDKILKKFKVPQNGNVPSYDLLFVERDGEYIIKDSDGQELLSSWKIEGMEAEFNKLVKETLA